MASFKVYLLDKEMLPYGPMVDATSSIVTTSGAFTNLYEFGPSPDANNSTYSTPLQASDGKFHGLSAIVQRRTSVGAAYEAEVSPGLPAPVQPSLSAKLSPPASR